MELDQAAWVVHRHLVDPRLDELDLPLDAHADPHLVTTDFGHSPIMPIDLPADLWGLDTRALEDVALQALTLLAATEPAG